MAIRMMVPKEVFEGREASGRKVVKVSDYHGAEEGLIRHHESCPHYNGGAKEIRLEGLYEDCPKRDYAAKRYDGCDGPFDALYMETTHEGLVLELREYNGYDDSDFYAVVWNPEKGSTERVEYATTRGWTYPNGAWVDATPEVLEAFRAWSSANAERAEVAAKLARAEKLREQIIAEAREVRKGDRAKVVKGRKVKKGTEGVVIWVGSGDWGPRVGLKDDSGEVHWTAATNVERVGWEREVEVRLTRAGLQG